MTADNEGQQQAQRRESIQRRLARVEAAISQWRAWEASRFRPDGQQRTVAQPELPLDQCLDLRRMLLAELARLGPVGSGGGRASNGDDAARHAGSEGLPRLVPDKQ